MGLVLFWIRFPFFVHFFKTDEKPDQLKKMFKTYTMMWKVYFGYAVRCPIKTGDPTKCLGCKVSIPLISNNEVNKLIFVINREESDKIIKVSYHGFF